MGDERNINVEVGGEAYKKYAGGRGLSGLTASEFVDLVFTKMEGLEHFRLAPKVKIVVTPENDNSVPP